MNMDVGEENSEVLEQFEKLLKEKKCIEKMKAQSQYSSII